MFVRYAYIGWKLPGRIEVGGEVGVSFDIDVVTVEVCAVCTVVRIIGSWSPAATYAYAAVVVVGEVVVVEVVVEVVVVVVVVVEVVVLVVVVGVLVVV